MLYTPFGNEGALVMSCSLFDVIVRVLFKMKYSPYTMLGLWDVTVI